MSSRCVLCGVLVSQQEFANIFVEALEDQGTQEIDAAIDWLELKRTVADELEDILPGDYTLTLSGLRRHVHDHIIWVRL